MGFNKKEYKESQLVEWNNSAPGWEKWWKFFEIGAQHISDEMINLAEIKNGDRVLDVGTGIGEPSITAAKIVGSNGHVAATDLSDKMLAIARNRAKEQNLQNMTFHISDAEELNLNEDPFDAVLSRWVLMFVTDLDATSAAIHQNLKPGGKLVAAVWPNAMDVSFGRVVFGVIMRVLKVPRPPKGTPGIFSLGDTLPLEESLKKQGFKSIQKQSIKFDINLDSIDDFLQFIKDISAPINEMLSKFPEEIQNEVWSEIGKAASEFENKENGKVVLPNKAILIIATA